MRPIIILLGFLLSFIELPAQTEADKQLRILALTIPQGYTDQNMTSFYQYNKAVAKALTTYAAKDMATLKSSGIDIWKNRYGSYTVDWVLPDTGEEFIESYSGGIIGNYHTNSIHIDIQEPSVTLRIRKNLDNAKTVLRIGGDLGIRFDNSDFEPFIYNKETDSIENISYEGDAPRLIQKIKAAKKIIMISHYTKKADNRYEEDKEFSIEAEFPVKNPDPGLKLLRELDIYFPN